MISKQELFHEARLKFIEELKKIPRQVLAGKVTEEIGKLWIKYDEERKWTADTTVPIYLCLNLTKTDTYKKDCIIFMEEIERVLNYKTKEHSTPVTSNAVGSCEIQDELFVDLRVRCLFIPHEGGKCRIIEKQVELPPEKQYRTERIVVCDD